MSHDLGEVRLETLIAHTRLAVAATDAEGRMTLYSPALQEILGVADHEVDEDGMVEHFDLFDSDGKTRLDTDSIPLVRARRGEVVNNAVVSTRRGGRTVFMRCNAAPLRSGAEIVGAIVLVQDVTAEHSAQVEQEELRERLVVTINHELRTPLTKLLGHAELLQEHRDELPGGLQQSIDVVCRSAHDLRRLAEVISGLADLESHARLTKAPGDLGTVVEGCAARLSGVASLRGIRITVDVPEPVTATVDATELARAVDALLENAVHYAPDDTEVGVRVTSEPRYVRVDVWDHGSGISAGERDRVVQPFERGEHPRQPLTSKGLGLPVARTVAIAHGGELRLDDHEPCGLRASLVLPRHGGDEADDDVSGSAGRQGG